MKGEVLSDKLIIDGLKKSDNKIITYIYKNFKPNIVKYIIKEGGDKHDADDIFQLILIDIKDRIENERTVIDNFGAYIHRSAVYAWQVQIKKNTNENRRLKKYINEKDVVEADENEFDKRPSTINFFSHYNYLQDDCKKVFRFQSKGLTYKLIAEKMNTTEGYIKQLRRRCNERLFNKF